MEKPRLIEELGRVYPNEKSKNKRKCALYECPYCKTIFKGAIDDMRNGDIKSCGCLKSQITIDRNYKHGLSEHPLYTTWSGIKYRCYSPTDRQYKDYGGRGIIMCDEWLHNPEKFIEWGLSHGYNKDLTINRIDTNGNYTPSNCNFADRLEQCQNTRLIRKTNTSGYRGVSFWNGQWHAQIRSNKHDGTIGKYATKEDAAWAYNQRVIKLGSHQPLNKLPDWYKP